MQKRKNRKIMKNGSKTAETKRIVPCATNKER